jgi:hypothetical protein
MQESQRRQDQSAPEPPAPPTQAEIDAKLDKRAQIPPPKDDKPPEENVLLREGPDALDGADIEDPEHQL